jgi:hypothetical protein
MKRAFAMLAALLIAPAAFADDMTFYMKNETGGGIAVELRARDRDYLWPGDGKVYFLETGERKSVQISCDAGENICYAAWINGDDQVSWGVGPDGDKVCGDCCRICVEKATETIAIGR